MSGADVGHPIAHGLVDRLLEGGLASRDGYHFGAEEFHAGHVHRLPLHVGLAHVNDALATEASGHRGRGHTMLARAGFGDDPLFAHAPGEQDLAERVVNLMRASVQQVFAFQVNPGAAELGGQSFREIKRGGPAGEIAQKGGQFLLKSGIVFGASIFVGQLLERGHQCLGHEHAAIGAEVAGRIG